MSGSRLGRGRGGRLAVYGGCGVVVILLVFLYRAATSEMARLRELHVQCAHQQEALAAQLQVIFEYKVRLEKSLAEEKSSNAALKDELQQRATQEKNMRDRDSMEAMQKFNSLQQSYKILETEHRDFTDDCKKREKMAVEEAKKHATIVQDLQNQLKQVKVEKEETLEKFKTKYFVLSTNHSRLEERYKDLLRNTDNATSTVEHLRKEVFQLNRELQRTKTLCKEIPADPLAIPKPTPLEKRASQNSIDQPLLDEKTHLHVDQIPSSSLKPSILEKNFSLTRSTLNVSSSPIDKSLALPLALPLPVGKSPTKVKLPIGVVPIPMIRDQKDERIDEKRKNKLPETSNAAKQLPVEQNQEKQENDWLRVQPGFQEIGDEPNHLGRLAGLDEGDREGEVGDEQYDAIDYYKEPHPKNNDIHIVEAEDEGEDEDDQLDYLNNNRQNKHD